MQKFNDLSLELKKKHFGEGEWLNEADRMIFEYEGIHCTIKRMFIYESNGSGFGGYFCGYCTIPKGHVWENAGMEDFDIEVHGGITFTEKDPETNLTIVGFDCAHSQDIVPSTQFLYLCDRKIPSYLIPTYKNLQYVINECKSMAEQIAERQSI